MKNIPQLTKIPGNHTPVRDNLTLAWHKIAVLITLLITMGNLSLQAQCCSTNSLILNTGINPATTGTPATLPVGSIDPKWKATYVSPAAISSSGFTGPNTYAISPGGWVTNPSGQPGGWISFTPYGGYVTSGGLSMSTYVMTLQRCFHLCSPTTLNFDLNVSDDDFITSLTISYPGGATGNLLSQTPTGLNTYDLTFAHVATPTITCGAGDVCISVTINNYPLVGFNPHGFDLYGTVSNSGAPAIISENSSCTGFIYCIEPPITGTMTCCVNQDKTLSDAYAGGTWSSTNTAVATIDLHSGTYHGVSAGTSIISYTDPCNRVVTCTVTVLPIPTITSVGHSPASVCVGDIVNLYSSASAPGGITGTHWTGGGIIVSPFSSSTNAYPTTLPFHTYAVTVTGANGCTATMTTTVGVNPLPILFNVTGGGSFCPGGLGAHIGLSGSQYGINYSLSIGSTTYGPFAGTGGALDFGLYILPGTYTVRAVNSTTGCVNNMTGSATITINPLPAFAPTYTSPHYPIICVGDSWSLLSGISGSYSYAWTGPVPFTSVASNPLMPSATVSQTGIYSLTVTNTLTGCSRTLTENITVNPLPAAFTVTGGGNYCAGGIGMHVGLSGSVTGVNYQLYCGGVLVGIPLAGTGSPLDFGLMTLAGIYTVVGTSTTTLCSSNMLSSVVITIDPTPLITLTSPYICLSATRTATASIGGGTWISGNTSVATVTYGLGATTDITGIAVGTAIISYTSMAGCVGTLTITVVPNPAPVILVNSGKTHDMCVGDVSYMFIDPVSLAGITGSVTYLWSSSNPLVARVDPLGLTASFNNVTGIACGTATISCVVTTVLGGCVGYATYNVTVHKPTITIASVPVATPSTTPGAPPVVLECGGATLTPTMLDCATGLPITALRYVWYPALPTSTIPPGQAVANPPVITTYTITGTDEWSCSATSDITVVPVKNPCVCSAISAGIDYHPFGLSTTTGIPGVVGSGTSGIAGFYPSGNYYMQNDVTINGTVHLIGMVIYINPSLKITVTPGSKLILDNCHLLSCGDMWQGIVLKSNAPLTSLQGTIELTNNTMIEDAIVAVDVPSPNTPASYLPTLGLTSGELIVNCNSAVFNKNITGIRISDYHNTAAPVFSLGASTTYTYPEALHYSYPFVIENTVFTSRDFSNYSTVAGSTLFASYPNIYPYNWAPAYGPYSPKTPYTGLATPYDAPFNVDNPTACPNGGYLRINCNNGELPMYGIDLENVGYTAPLISGPPGQYSGVAAGAVPATVDNMEQVQFDNLHIGINSHNSNLAVRNSVFMHMEGPINAVSNGGIGIYATNTNPTGPANEYKLYVYGSDGSGLPGTGGSVATNCSFWDCIIGIQATEYYHVKAEYTKICSKHTIDIMTNPKGMLGISVSGSYYYDIQLNHNDIANITTGIDVYARPPAGLSVLYGQISACKNRLSATFPFGVAPIYGEYMYQAMNISEDPSAPGYTIHPNTQVNIDNNKLDKVYNGIHSDGFINQQQPVTITGNNIMVRRDIVSSTYTTLAQTGIKMTNTDPGYIENNEVYSLELNIPTPSTWTVGYYTTPVMEAIHVEGLSGTFPGGVPPFSTVGCNLVHNINTGFFLARGKFDWINNTMKYNAFGYVLDGIIGDQTGPGAYSNNQWLPATGNWEMGVPQPKYQTYTYGTTDPGTSRLFVPLGDVLKDPTINGSDPWAIPYTVAPPIPLVPSIIESSTGTISNCPLVPASSVAFRHANGTTGDDENGDKPVITNVLNGQSYTLFPNPSNGTISLKQEIIDQRTLSGAIYNALGQKVFDGELNFESGITQVKLNNPTPGMYLLQLTDENGQRFTLKFTVE